MTKEIYVVKSDDSKEPLNLEKIHKVTIAACENLTGVSASQIEINSNIQFTNNIKTSDIQEILIKSAADLISLEAPNYQFAAARLLLMKLNKQVFGGHENLPSLFSLVKENVENERYHQDVLNMYTEDEWNILSGYIKHERDKDFTYAGLKQVIDKYLIQDRNTREIFETPQYAFMVLSAVAFNKYPKETRLKYVKSFYDMVSQFSNNLPTPVFSGLRSLRKQFASCCLIDIDDDLDSIFASNHAVGRYTAKAAGIGINVGRIRSLGSSVKGGEVVHTGVVPFLKVSQAAVKSCTQNGVRGGSANVNFPIWNKEIESLIVLKNEKGNEEDRIRHMDYTVQLSKLFLQRYIDNEEISLFSTSDAKDLYDSWGTESFDEIYLRCERNTRIAKKKIKARELINEIMIERAETGRIYIMFMDNVNNHSSFLDTVKMTNLCVEITLPTTPIQDIESDDGEIALCILSAINLGNLKNKEELENVCDLTVRFLDELIDYQEYPVKAAEKATLRRSLGIGYIGLAHFLAKHKLKYTDEKAWELVHEYTEAFQYYLLKASNQLAKEKGRCEYFHKTKYSQGILPIDTYKKDVDEIVEHNLHYDWEKLRADILEHGLRHSTLSAWMPSESSSVVSGTTNGVEPPRAAFTIKTSKKGNLPMIIPEYYHLRKHYTYLWEDPELMDGYIKTLAVIQKFGDQAISLNTSYNPANYMEETGEDIKLSMTRLVGDMFKCYKYGLKTMYYQNTYDLKDDVDNEKKDAIIESESDDCASGACTI